MKIHVCYEIKMKTCINIVLVAVTKVLPDSPSTCRVLPLEPVDSFCWQHCDQTEQQEVNKSQEDWMQDSLTENMKNRSEDTKKNADSLRAGEEDHELMNFQITHTHLMLHFFFPTVWWFYVFIYSCRRSSEQVGHFTVCVINPELWGREDPFFFTIYKYLLCIFHIFP